jgi:hypothetical protein
VDITADSTHVQTHTHTYLHELQWYVYGVIGTDNRVEQELFDSRYDVLKKAFHFCPDLLRRRREIYQIVFAVVNIMRYSISQYFMGFSFSSGQFPVVAVSAGSTRADI